MFREDDLLLRRHDRRPQRLVRMHAASRRSCYPVYARAHGSWVVPWLFDRHRASRPRGAITVCDGDIGRSRRCCRRGNRFAYVFRHPSRTEKASQAAPRAETASHTTKQGCRKRHLGLQCPIQCHRALRPVRRTSPMKPWSPSSPALPSQPWRPWRLRHAPLRRSGLRSAGLPSRIVRRPRWWPRPST